MGQSNTPTVRLEHSASSNGGVERPNPRDGAETQELFECSNGFRGEAHARVRETVPMAPGYRDKPAADKWSGGEEGIL